jgi:hypothetical protein
MNAPGNMILIFALLALFVACCGYAAGRVHQRRQTGHDREEAYRDGYETATRRVFSLAARVIGPKRSGAGGSAVAGNGPAGPGSASTSLSGISPAAAALSPSAASSPSSTANVPVPSASPLGAANVPVPSAPSLGARGVPVQVASSLGAAGVPVQLASSPRSGGVATSSGSEAVPAPLAGMTDLGFPVPMPPPSGTVPEPSAVGGVSYQTFPDPRTGGETTVLPDIRDLIGSAEAGNGHRVPRPSRPTSPAARPASASGVSASGLSASELSASGLSVPGQPVSGGSASEPLVRAATPGSAGSRPAGHRAAEGDDDDSVGAAVSDAVTSSGRHTVPDELVQASTYRLPPDRIFRAKVRDSGTPPDESTTRLVPKPRQS